MESPSPENTPPLTSRRDMLKLAMATGAGLAMGSVAAKAAPAKTPPVTAEEPGAPKSPPHKHKFKLGALKPVVDDAGGSVAECDVRNFPVVTKGGAAIFLLKLKPGGLREPHWHPNAWEMDYVVSGTVEMTVVSPDGPVDVFTLEPGDVAFVPQGFAHSILNTGATEAVIPIVFNSELPTDIGLSTMFGEFPTEQFTQTFGVPESAMAGIPKPKSTFVVVPKVGS